MVKKCSYGLAVLLIWLVMPYISQAAVGEWTWMSGSDTINRAGVYGTKGVPDAHNMSGARRDSISWTDSDGSLWLFGGSGYEGVEGSFGYLNDLWHYDPETNQWAWVSGSNKKNQTGTYGTMGVPDARNMPGGRFSSISWVGSDGTLWLFGGYGYPSAGSPGRLNDLWRYDPATNQWTWMNGPNTRNQIGAYGTNGSPDAANVPGSRDRGIAWTGSDGNLWLFGGYGYGNTTTSGLLNDLWRYDITTGEWTWVNGSNTINQAPVYGTNGIPDAANVPGARSNAISWIDSEGNLWLFGGSGIDYHDYLYGKLNDLWRYDVTTNIWTWISGSKTGSQKGTYGNKGVPHSSNIPGARFRSISWIDNTGNLWLFGGSGIDYVANHGELNDLWRYDPETNQWTWMSGSNTSDQIGAYGTNGFPSAANVPGSRDRGIAWTGSDGNLWLFGGYGYASEGSPGRLNDLWTYQLVECVLDSNCDETNICKQGFCIPKCMSDDDCIGGEQCQTNTGKCVECLSDTDCDDGISCNGAETCDEETCVTGISPCNDDLFCDESNDLCAQCLTNSDCSAREACVAGRCVTQYFSWIPDTGQTKCYNSTGEITCPQPGEAFYGQDAQHTRARSYTDLGSGIVRDDVTGLEWQQSPSLGATYWESALNYCNNLTLGGYSDWRLPTIDELQTLVDSSRKDPAINTTSFKGTVTDPGYSYWSATTYLPDIDDVWNVSFGWGNTTRAPKENWLHYLRAVRGEMPANNFIDNGDGTVTDTSTGLMWQQAATVSDEYNWQQALAYCENLSLAGYSDWRLPDRNELRSIIDYNSYDPAIDTNFFSVGDPAWCWSSTTNYYYPNHAFGVSESTGHTSYNYKENQNAVRAVRSFVCSDDIDCGVNYECEDGVCLPLCLSDNDCKAGALCNTDTGKCVKCFSDTDCDDGIFCNGAEACSNEICIDGVPPCLAGEVCDEAGGQCVECLFSGDCSEGYQCIEGACAPIPDDPPALGDGPFVAAGTWPLLSASSESPTYFKQNRSLLWTFSDDYASCSEQCTHTAEYQAVGESTWTSLTVTTDPDGQWYAQVALPIDQLQNATTYAFRFAVTDCAEQSTESNTYYFKVARTDAPPVIGAAYLAAGSWPILSTSASSAFVLRRNSDVLWTFSDDYAFCAGLCTHRARYRKVGDTVWTWIPVSADPEGIWYAYTTLPVTGLDNGTYQFHYDVRDCAGQRTGAPKVYYFKVQ